MEKPRSSRKISRSSNALKDELMSREKDAMPPMIQSKLPAVGTTISTVMSSLAAELGAVNLGQGFPDFSMNEELVALVSQAMRDGHNQYVHMNGLATLREGLAG